MNKLKLISSKVIVVKVEELKKLTNQNMDITSHMNDLKLEKGEVIEQNVLLINQINEKNDQILQAHNDKDELSRELAKVEVTLEGITY